MPELGGSSTEPDVAGSNPARPVCTKCCAWHDDIEKCQHDPQAPCSICGDPVGPLSMGGSNICCACDCGIPPELKAQFNASLLKGHARDSGTKEDVFHKGCWTAQEQSGEF